MKKRSIKVAKSLINFLMVLILLLGLATLGVTIYNSINFSVEAAKYIYALIGVFLMPFEYLMYGTIGKFQNQESNLVSLIISLVLVVLTITVLVNSSKMFNGKYSTTKRTIAGTIANFLIFAFFAFFAFGAVMFFVNYNQISNILNDIGPELVKTIMVNLGFNFIVLKEIIISVIGSLITIFALVLFLIGMSHKSTKVKIISSIYFYSSEYEEQQTETSASKLEQQEEEQVVNEMKEVNPKEKNLVNKIRQLDELRKAGKISNTDYTRLRQKAIRRYKN